MMLFKRLASTAKNMKLRSRLLLASIALLAAVVFSMAFINYGLTRRVLREELSLFSQTLTNRSQQYLDDKAFDLEKQVYQSFLSLLREIDYGQMSGASGVSKDIRLQPALSELLYQNENFLSYYYIDQEGHDILVNRYPGDIEGRKRVTLSLCRQYFDSRRKAGEGLSGVRRRGTWHAGYTNSSLCLIKPIYDSSFQYMGHIVVEVSSRFFTDIFSAAYGGDSSILLLVDENTNQLLQNSSVYKEESLQQLISRVSASREEAAVISLEGKEYFWERRSLTSSTVSLVGLIPVPDVSDYSHVLLVSSLAVGGAALLLSSLFAGVFSRRFSRNIEGLLQSMKQVSQGNLNVHVTASGSPELGQLADSFNSMSFQVGELLKQVDLERKNYERARYRMLEFQYYALNMQTNPHFLYNALEMINATAVLEKEGRVNELICRLSRLLRENVRRKNAFSPLGQEIENLKEYMQFYQDMYGSRLTYAVVVPEDLEPVEIPTLLLLPIVENAIVHGIAHRSGPGRVTVTAAAEKSSLLIAIEDDGVGMTADMIETILSRQVPKKAGGHSGVGVYGVVRRIRTLCGSPYGLSIQSAPGQGSRFTLRLPLCREEYNLTKTDLSDFLDAD